MDENKQMTKGGRNFVLLLMTLGIAMALCGAWTVLYPPPNPQTFTSKLNEVLMIGIGTSLAWSMVLVLRIKGGK